jgi:hypothetical protein
LDFGMLDLGIAGIIGRMPKLWRDGVDGLGVAARPEK